MPIFFLMLGLTMGLGSGVTASVALYIGQKNKNNADNCAEHALALAFIISLVCATLKRKIKIIYIIKVTYLPSLKVVNIKLSI